MENSDSKEILLSIFGIALLVLAVAGISYAVFTFSEVGKRENVISTGKISLSFIESSENVIHINNALPMSDSVGKVQNEYFDFSLEAVMKGSSTIYYEIRAKQVEVEDNIEASKVKFYLEKEKSSSYQEVLKPTNFNINRGSNINNNSMDLSSMLLYSDNFTNNLASSQKMIDRYRLRIWIDENTPIESTKKNFKFKVNVYANM